MFSRFRARALALGAAALFSISSCGFGDQPLGVVDPQAAPLQPTYEQVKEILDRRCLVCHGSSGGDGEGGEDIDYSTCAGIQAGLDGILQTGVLSGSMPPGALPRLTEREKLTVYRWIDQGACSPCNPCP